ncbi:DegV family protein [Sporosalibacterium faouarense]|uniref:DegV family protein n=1 Tax=Sporosalibacterium faouarense TaxID=516123 RepID=UPI00141D0A1C|nr:DegV family protein [Sporosalibacterium faouarense]MTI46978.1 DegV family protein [Bacillota bacterium]
MDKIKIITDSVSDIPVSIAKDLDIDIVPLTINFEDGSYRDGIEITNEEFYKKLSECDKLPTTSQVTLGEFLEVYKKYINEYDHIIVITMSFELSGTYQSAITAAEIGEIEDKVTVIDSKGITLGQGLMVLEAARMAKRGESKDKIVDRVQQMIRSIEYIFVVDTLENLKKGGRLSATKAYVGEKLKIKPVLTMEKGKLIMTGKVRGRKKVINWLIKEIKKKDIDFSNQTIAINHTDCKDFAIELYEQVQKHFSPKEIIMGEVGATVGTHAGTGAVAIYFESIKS